MKFAALVPMRHHSQRVPGKNYRPLAGKPLFHHILETLLAVPEIETVIVDTDSDPVMDGVSRSFPAVKLIQRPEHLRADDVPMNEILLHDTAEVQADFYLQTHSTNPLLKAGTMRQTGNKATVQFIVGGREVTYQMTFDTLENPFSVIARVAFTCPDGL